LRTIAATTWGEYKKYFERDAALSRRFQVVKLDEPSVATAVTILRGLKGRYEQDHGVTVRDDAAVAAAELSNRYISGRFLPDKAVDLLDTAASRVKVNLSHKPDRLEDRERRIADLERMVAALERDQGNGLDVDREALEDARVRTEELRVQAEELEERWQRERTLVSELLDLRKAAAEAAASGERDPARDGEAARCLERLAQVQGDDPLIRHEVDPEVVAQVVSDWTGIPLGKLQRDESRAVLGLEEHLRGRIRGQDQALAVMAQALKAAKSGLKEPDQPQCVFLLVGPSGVGKTETALAFSDLLFGDESSMISINMSEFQEKHTVSRLIGSPPGYVGYGEGGVLTEAVRQRPYSVVLLDEVEKADLEVMNLFYQVFDKGVLADGEGRVIDFRNTIFFLTSNLGSEVIANLCAQDPHVPLDTITEAVRPLLSGHFKPALLGRMTVVPYATLDPDTMKENVRLKLDRLVERTMRNNRMALTYGQAIVDSIAERCTEVETGARNIDHIMRGTILPRLSEEILSRMYEGGMPRAAELDLDAKGAVTVRFSQ
jgi:type VI secretion system protein VasG